MRRLLVVPLAAFLAVLPFLTGGHSCGHDFTFHMQSWLDTAGQLRHGTLLPRWTFFAAFNAGEPRFLFYPPLSWLLGALLTLILPFNLVPTAITWIILCIAGFSMFRLARGYASEPIALLAACVFLSNPFMLWTVTGRNAYAELLAAAICPLLIAAMLAPRPTPWRIGFPLALMWLSNVPGGVIGTYVFLFLATVGVLRHIPRSRSTLQRRDLCQPALRLTITYAGGLIFGLTLAAFFLVPAIYERRYIHLASAFVPHLRPVDNLFLHRTLSPDQDSFLIHTAHIAVAMAVVACIALLVARLRVQSNLSANGAAWRLAGVPVTALTAVLLFGITFLSAPLWRALPALWLVQFPWRTLFALGVCMALALALALRHIPVRPLPAALAGLLLTAALSYAVIRATRVPCRPDQQPLALQADSLRHHAPDPTDEYVPATGNADFLRPDNPPFWLADTPSAYAPGTTPNLAATDPTAEWPLVPDEAHLLATPLHFSVTTAAPSYLVVNLQDYPSWRITRNGEEVLSRLHRPDGLLTIALPAGPSTLSIRWHHSWDEYLGGAISLLALLAFLLSLKPSKALLFFRSNPVEVSRLHSQLTTPN